MPPSFTEPTRLVPRRPGSTGHRWPSSENTWDCSLHGASTWTRTWSPAKASSTGVAGSPWTAVEYTEAVSGSARTRSISGADR